LSHKAGIVPNGKALTEYIHPWLKMVAGFFPNIPAPFLAYNPITELYAQMLRVGSNITSASVSKIRMAQAVLKPI